jgi:peptide/nickel transport system substrate-binding protein
LLTVNPAALASELHDSIVIAIQSVKTLQIRPFEPLEYDILSVYNIVYDSLVKIDDNYLPQPCLAERWEESSSGKNWTFYLRDDVRFSDGTPLTARDVAASARYILEKAGSENAADRGFYRNISLYVDSVSAKDDYTVVFKTKRPCYGILYQMTFPVVPEAYVASDNPPGSGPYIITEFHAGDSMWLSSNSNWWQAQPQIKEILFTFEDTASKVIDSYEFAQVDAAFTRSLAGAQQKNSATSLSITYRTHQLECLYMNNNARELSTEVRKAIRCLIDKSKIISTAYMGLAVPTNFPFYPGTWTYNDSLDASVTKDIEEAKRLLSEAGWDDSDENGVLDRINGNGELENLHLRLFYYEEPDNDVRGETANIISSALSEVGIACKITAMSMTDMQQKMRSGAFDLALVAFSMDATPDPGFMLMTSNTANYNRYSSSRMDELFSSLRKETTQEGYRQRLMEIQSLFLNDCPFVCLYWRTGNVVSRYMYTTCRDVREFELLRGIESFTTQ